MAYGKKKLTCTLNANLEENLQVNSNKIQYEGPCLKTMMCACCVVSIV
jgi:hypothetical protein